MRSAKTWAIIAIGSYALFSGAEPLHSQEVVTVTEPQAGAETNVSVSNSAPSAETISSIVNAGIAQAFQEQRLAGGHLAEMLQELENSDNVELNLDDARIVFGATEIGADEVVRGDLVVLGGELAVKGEVTGDIVSFGGDVRLFRGASVGGDVVSIDGIVTGSESLVDGVVRAIDSPFDFPAPRKFARFDFEPNVSAPLAVGGGIMTLLATLVAFSSIGFGLTFFAPKQLNIIAARVSESPGKSFMAGLFAQPLILPVLAMLAVGLAVSIVGIILIPFALIAAVVGIGGMALVGYLAVASSFGARHAQHRAARLGKEANTNQFEAIVRGLIIGMAVWLPAILLSWIPFAGIPMAALALLFTWAVATAGFGAVLTTRAGFEGQLPWRRRGKIDTATNSLTRY